MNLCEYGCGNEGIFQLKNGKWACNKKWQSCPSHREKVKEQTTGENNPLFGKTHSHITKQKIRLKAIGRIPWNKGKPRDQRVKIILKEKLKGRVPWNKGIEDFSSRRKIEGINEKYKFFSKIEEMRYNPNKTHYKEIQVHCKNHSCIHSKEQGGWFTPTGRQLEARLTALENQGMDLNYFYCSEKCKIDCPLYGLWVDPFRSVQIKPYTQSDYQTFREYVLKRDNYKCQYCNEQAEHVHHERPQKLEPFFSLDPDLAWSVCKGCHYEKGHSYGCSTWNLANAIC